MDPEMWYFYNKYEYAIGSVSLQYDGKNYARNYDVNIPSLGIQSDENLTLEKILNNLGKTGWDAQIIPGKNPENYMLLLKKASFKESETEREGNNQMEQERKEREEWERERE